ARRRHDFDGHGDVLALCLYSVGNLQAGRACDRCAGSAHIDGLGTHKVQVLQRFEGAAQEDVPRVWFDVDDVVARRDFALDLDLHRNDLWRLQLLDVHLDFGAAGLQAYARLNRAAIVPRRQLVLPAYVGSDAGEVDVGDGNLDEAHAGRRPDY